jgi:hypothetical protein
MYNKNFSIIVQVLSLYNNKLMRIYIVIQLYSSQM